MYSVSRKNCENSAAATSSWVAFDVASVRKRNIRIGSSGACDRSSITTKDAIRAAETARSPIVDVVPPPCWDARVIRSVEHTSEIQSPWHLICRLLPGHIQQRS